jgi:hypothetical protein
VAVAAGVVASEADCRGADVEGVEAEGAEAEGAEAEGAGTGTAESWAAAATEALPMTRIVGSPSWQAAEATSASASA